MVSAADIDPNRPGIVHRLDRDTSGLLLVALTRATQAALQAQFKARTVDKIYQALVYGHLSPPEAMIEAPLARDPQQRQRMAVVGESGRPALTRYRASEYYQGATLAEVTLLTGRTHQIRVHMASIGYPWWATGSMARGGRPSQRRARCCTPGDCRSITLRAAGA